MKTSLVRSLAALGVACLLTACPETEVGPDFGFSSVVLKAADWDGTYEVLDDDDLMQLQVTDGPKGQITLTEVPGPQDKKDKKDKPLILTLRRATQDKDDRLYFATLREHGKTEPDLPLYLLRATGEGSILLWMVDDKKVEAAIKSGQLKGSVKPDKDGAHSRLDSDAANYPVILQPQFWNWTEPAVMQRRKK